MTRIRFAGLALALCCTLAAAAPLAGAAAPSDPFAGAGPWMVRAWFGDEAMLREVASWGDHYQLDRKYGFVRILADGDRVARLRALGFFVEVDERGTALIRHAENAAREAAERAARGEAPEAGIPGFPCFRTVEESYASAQAIAAAHPNLAAVVDIGDSWEKVTGGGLPGYDLLVLKLTNSAIPGPKPIFFIEGAIHAREYATAELALRFAESLVNGYGVDPDATWILDSEEIHVLLQTNPDGRKHAEGGVLWRKNTNENYCGPTSQDRGADLNRNFSFQWNCCGGSDSWECGETYHGAAAASEPEVQAVQSYLRANFTDDRANTWPGGAAPATKSGIFLDIHSYADEVLWAARLHPYRKSGTLSPEEVARLHHAMQATLAEATSKVRAAMGERIDDKPREFLAVHMKTGEPCPRCGSAISVVGANRKITNFCRTCQPGGLIRGM